MTVHALNVRRRSPWVRRGILIVGALAALALIWLVWFSQVFSVNEVRVVGATGAAADAVVQAAQVPVGVPLAQVDADVIGARVRTLTWIDDVEVRRAWPRSVVLAVQERSGLARREDELVDATGVAFTPLGPIPPNLPLVRADGPALQAAMSVYTALPEKWRSRVVRVTANTRDDVSLTLRSGVLVRWGGPERTEFKASVLDALTSRRAAIYDVSAPELPTTTGKRR